MIGQINMFEILGTDDLDTDINQLTVEDMAGIVGRALGLTFARDGEEFVAKSGKLTLTVGFSNYMINDHRRFISVSWDNKKNHSGGGGPCDSLREAVERFRLCMRERS